MEYNMDDRGIIDLGNGDLAFHLNSEKSDKNPLNVQYDVLANKGRNEIVIAAFYTYPDSGSDVSLLGIVDTERDEIKAVYKCVDEKIVDNKLKDVRKDLFSGYSITNIQTYALELIKDANDKKFNKLAESIEKEYVENIRYGIELLKQGKIYVPQNSIETVVDSTEKPKSTGTTETKETKSE